METINTKYIQKLVGLSHLTINFKVHDDKFKTSLGECWGLCTGMNRAFRIDYTFNGDVRKAVLTILHELRHVLQMDRDEKLDCNEADLWALDMIDYVMEGL